MMDYRPVFMWRMADGELVRHLFDHSSQIPNDEGWADSPDAARAVSAARPVEAMKRGPGRPRKHPL